MSFSNPSAQVQGVQKLIYRRGMRIGGVPVDAASAAALAVLRSSGRAVRERTGLRPR